MLHVAFILEYQPGRGRAEDRLALDADRVYQVSCLRSSIGGDTKGQSLPLREDITGNPCKDIQTEYVVVSIQTRMSKRTHMP